MADRTSTLQTASAYVLGLARRSRLTEFWSWWAAEFDAIVPAGPRAAWERRRLRPVLAFEHDRASLWLPATGDGPPTLTEHGSIGLTGDANAVSAAGRAALAPLTAMVYGGVAGNASVVLCLPAGEVLRRTITLPQAVEPTLRQTLTYDLDRHTPFKADELYFDAVVVGRDQQLQTLRVDLAAVRRTVVDQALRHAVAWGATVAAVVPVAPLAASRSRQNLLPPELRTAHSFWRRWQFWLPLALLVVAAVAATVLPVWQKRDYAIQLNTLVDQARGQAAVSETLRQELETRTGDYNFALERKYAYPTPVQVIDDVAKLLPDDTWLTQFELKTVTRGKEATQHEVFLRGEAANAGRLVQVFEESKLFTQAAPRSPTTKIQPGPGEIFDLGAQLRPLPPPVATPVLPVATPPAPTAEASTPPEASSDKGPVPPATPAANATMAPPPTPPPAAAANKTAGQP